MESKSGKQDLAKSQLNLPTTPLKAGKTLLLCGSALSLDEKEKLTCGVWICGIARLKTLS